MKNNPPSSLLVLVRLLAETDAIFRPLRDPSSSNWRAVWSLRAACSVSGVPWHVGGDSANRKAGERELKELVGAALAVAGASGSRTDYVKLTPSGDAVARRLADLPGVAEAVETCRLLDSLRDDDDASATGSCPGHCDERPWHPETTFADGRRGWGDGNQSLLVGVMHRMACGLACGLIESNSDAQRHVRFRLTPAGLAVARGKVSLPIIKGLPRSARWAADAYDREFDVALKSLRGIADDSIDVGRIPLPCSFLTKGTAKELATGKCQ